MDSDDTFNALKYPDYCTWRDLDAAMKNGSRWPTGEPVRLTDPEMKPWMDTLRQQLRDPEYAREFLKSINLNRD
jgi:hypothetical protein